MPDPFELLYVPRAKLVTLWPLLCPFIERALVHSDGEYLADDVRAYAEAGRMQLWGAVRAETVTVVGAVATQICESPRKRILQIVAVAGHHFDDWADSGWAKIERFALDEGCDLFRCNGRPGWIRKFAGPHGFHLSYHTLTKALP